MLVNSKEKEILKNQVSKSLKRNKLIYICPSYLESDLVRLDFYLPVWDMYIECKVPGMNNPIKHQVDRVHNCIVLVGLDATNRFCNLLDNGFIKGSNV